MKASDRRQQILVAFANMLEDNPGARITTAALAKHVGVSEAALYRHFPSKAKMLEGLIEFIENSIFTRISRITKDPNTTASQQCGQLLWLLLTFVERNPGFARILMGDALQGESDRLRKRMRQFFDRIETQLRQIIRQEQALSAQVSEVSPNVSANLLLAAAEGRINQFARSEFKDSPTQSWEIQWGMLKRDLFRVAKNST